jgi:hypothetical protein
LPANWCEGKRVFSDIEREFAANGNASRALFGRSSFFQDALPLNFEDGSPKDRGLLPEE